MLLAISFGKIVFIVLFGLFLLFIIIGLGAIRALNRSFKSMEEDDAEKNYYDEDFYHE